jgi:ribosomal protein S18 acetylase RimI-like enzyme
MLLKIRNMQSAEFELLNNFLYEAIYIPERQVKPDRTILKLPELTRYVKDFGKEHDICLVAELEDKIVGAVWTRLFSKAEPGFGFVDDKTPELSMSVLEDYRSQGIGTRLLENMIDTLKMKGYKQVSLSVDMQNYAFRLYKKYGFSMISENDKSAILLKNLSEKLLK